MRRRPPGIVVVAAAVGAVVVAGAAVASSASGGQAQQPPDAVVELQREVDAMRADGLPADDPKVQMLEREIDALVAGSSGTTVPDPGMSGGAGTPGAQADTPAEAAQLGEQLDRGQAADAGTVECEAVPEALPAAEVAAAASCLSVPQPDGTSRYLAVEPGGTVHVVRFGDDGRATRLADRRLPVDPADPAADQVALVPGGDGSVAVLYDGVEMARLDVG